MRGEAPSPAAPSPLAAAAVFAAAALWGTTGTVQGLLPGGRDPLAVAALRVTIGAAGLLAFCVASGARPSAFAALPRRDTLLAGGAIALYNVSFFSGVSLAGVGVGTAVALGSGPLWVSLYDTAVRGMWPSRARLGGQLLSVAGVIALVTSGGRAGLAGPGQALAALAGLSYAAYSVATNRLGAAGPASVTAAATFSVAACLLAPVLTLADRSWVDGPSLVPLLFLGLGATGVAFFLFTYGAGRMPAATAVTLALAEPLTAWLLATVVLREPLSASKLVGAAMLFSGLGLTARGLARDGGGPR
jgi:drug/metabolite transporter, DME family